MPFLSSSADYKSGSDFLTNRLQVRDTIEARTVRKLKSSIVVDKNRIPLLAGPFDQIAVCPANKRGGRRHELAPKPVDDARTERYDTWCYKE